MRFDIVAATQNHAQIVALNMRAADANECLSVGMTPLEATCMSLGHSDSAWTWLIDGEPAAIGGIIYVSALGGISSAWLLTAKIVDQHPVAFARMTMRMKRAVTKVTPVILGQIHSDHSKALKWAAWLGLVINEPQENSFREVRT